MSRGQSPGHGRTGQVRENRRIGVPGVCSWSGGKDSALALQLALEAGTRPLALLTMLDESGERSRSHGLPLELLRAQAAACGLPLVTRSASWDDYTDAFADALAELRRAGSEVCVFGDIDLDDHRRWCRDVCARAGLEAVHPLWGRDRRGLVEELLARGFGATIVVVRDGVVDRPLLGRRLDAGLLAELEAAGVDACGENGEFHTAVDDAPFFAHPLVLRADGELTVADCRCLRVRVG